MSKEAYVTLLYDQKYLPGAVTLAQALIDTGTQRPFVVLITPDLAQVGDVIDTLKSSGYTDIRKVDALGTPEAARKQFQLLGRPELDKTFTKLRLWQCLAGDYSKVVFLDADCFPVKNIDELFALDLEEGEIAASPDAGWPDIFNSGVFVTKPSTEVYAKLIKSLASTDNNNGNAKTPSFDGGDQGLLNQSLSWKRIPFLFNTTPSASYQYLPAYEHFKDDIKVLHFAGVSKPWNRAITGSFGGGNSASAGSVEHLINRWNEVFSKTTLGQATKIHSGALPLDFSHTISAPVDRWDPTKFKPPLDSTPEAPKLVVTHYAFAGDEQQPQQDSVFVYPEYGQEVVKFPWEAKSKPERVFQDYV